VSVPITVLLYGLLLRGFNVSIKGLNVKRGLGGAVFVFSYLSEETSKRSRI